MELKKLSGKGEITKTLDNNFQWNLSTVGRNTRSEIVIEATGSVLDKFELTPTCGCTISDVQEKESSYEATIVYNSKGEGSFTKTVKVSYIENKKKQNALLKIKVQVV